LLLRSQVDDLGWCAQELSRLPFAFEIRRPAELRTALAAHAGRLLRLARGESCAGSSGLSSRSRL
jgi:hypothetical protein